MIAKIKARDPDQKEFLQVRGHDLPAQQRAAAAPPLQLKPLLLLFAHDAGD